MIWGGLLLIILASITAIRTGVFLSQSKAVEAVVIDVRREDNPGEATASYFPTFRYTTEEGEVLESTVSIGSNLYDYSRGEKATILYSVSNPKSIAIPGLFSLWGLSIILGLGGIGILGMGIVMRRAWNLAKQRNRDSMPGAT